MTTPQRVKKISRVTAPDTDSVDYLIDQLEEAKRLRKAYLEREELLTTEVIRLMEQEGEARHKSEYSGNVAKIVHQSLTELDEQKLKKALGAPVFKTITVERVDRKLLESNIAAGKIDGVVVASCMEERPKKPYVLIDIPKERK